MKMDDGIISSELRKVKTQIVKIQVKRKPPTP